MIANVLYLKGFPTALEYELLYIYSGIQILLLALILWWTASLAKNLNIKPHFLFFLTLIIVTLPVSMTYSLYIVGGYFFAAVTTLPLSLFLCQLIFSERVGFKDFALFLFVLGFCLANYFATAPLVVGVVVIVFFSFFFKSKDARASVYQAASGPGYLFIVALFFVSLCGYLFPFLKGFNGHALIVLAIPMIAFCLMLAGVLSLKSEQEKGKNKVKIILLTVLVGAGCFPLIYGVRHIEKIPLSVSYFAMGVYLLCCVALVLFFVFLKNKSVKEFFGFWIMVIACFVAGFLSGANYLTEYCLPALRKAAGYSSLYGGVKLAGHVDMLKMIVYNPWVLFSFLAIVLVLLIGLSIFFSKKKETKITGVIVSLFGAAILLLILKTFPYSLIPSDWYRLRYFVHVTRFLIFFAPVLIVALVWLNFNKGRAISIALCIVVTLISGWSLYRYYHVSHQVIHDLTQLDEQKNRFKEKHVDGQFFCSGSALFPIECSEFQTLMWGGLELKYGETKVFNMMCLRETSAISLCFQEKETLQHPIFVVMGTTKLGHIKDFGGFEMVWQSPTLGSTALIYEPQ